MPRSRPAAKKRGSDPIPGFIPVATAPPTAAPPVEIILPSGIRILAGTATDAILMAVALLSATPRC